IIVSHAATVILIYWYARRSYPASRWPAVLAALFVAIGAGLKFIQAGFGTPLFGLLCAVAWICALELSTGDARRRATRFAVATFLLGLSRPEGVLLGAFMLAAVAIINPAAGRRAFVAMVGVFGICGGAYLAWRSIYFGHMLPGPYL